MNSHFFQWSMVLSDEYVLDNKIEIDPYAHVLNNVLFLRMRSRASKRIGHLVII